jgi:hypothetical protein
MLTYVAMAFEAIAVRLRCVDGWARTSKKEILAI